MANVLSSSYLHIARKLYNDSSDENNSHARSVGAEVHWLYSSNGMAFFLAGDWISCYQSSSTSVNGHFGNGGPIAHLSHLYRETLFKDALELMYGACALSKATDMFRYEVDCGLLFSINVPMLCISIFSINVSMLYISILVARICLLMKVIHLFVVVFLLFVAFGRCV